MPVNEENKSLLKSRNIELLSETKANAIIKFSDSCESIKMSRRLYYAMLLAIKNSKKTEINIPESFVGFEFEFVGSRNPIRTDMFKSDMTHLFGESYQHIYESYTHNDGTVWLLGRDGSIAFSRVTQLLHHVAVPIIMDDAYGFELSTPKLKVSSKDFSSLDKVSKVLKLIKEDLNGDVNTTCGTHVHIGVNTYQDTNVYKKTVRRLLSIYSIIEKKIFDPLVPTSRRRNRYCLPSESMVQRKYQKCSARYCEFDESYQCKTFRLEYRQLEGTLDFDTVRYWAILQLTLLSDILPNCITSEQEDEERFNSYLLEMANTNSFDILFKYEFDQDLIEFFIKRIVQFKSRSI